MEDQVVVKEKQKRGFARLTPEQRQAASSKGGRQAHAMGRAYEWDKESARAAGRKGGIASRGSRGRILGPKAEVAGGDGR